MSYYHPTLEIGKLRRRLQKLESMIVPHIASVMSATQQTELHSICSSSGDTAQ